MQPTQAGLEQLKQRMRATWIAGDFGQIAKVLRGSGEAFVARLGVKPGAKVLDVACGTGNLAIPAAEAGAKVTGLDIAPNLLEQAREEAAAKRLDATFDEGDAEQLPYADGAFDVVVTMFGAMFAPRPERTASELIRVCRQGGTIAMGNWMPGGFVAKMFAAGGRFVPPPEGVPPPALWGDDATVRQRLASGTSNIRTTPQPITFEFPFGPSSVVQFFRDYFGPVQMTFARLDAGKLAEYAADLEKLWRDHNEATSERTLIHTDYLEVVATRS